MPTAVLLLMKRQRRLSLCCDTRDKHSTSWLQPRTLIDKTVTAQRLLPYSLFLHVSFLFLCLKMEENKEASCFIFPTKWSASPPHTKHCFIHRNTTQPRKNIQDSLLEFFPLAMEICFLSSTTLPVQGMCRVDGIQTNSWTPLLSAHNPLTHITVELATDGNWGHSALGYLAHFRFQS